MKRKLLFPLCAIAGLLLLLCGLLAPAYLRAVDSRVVALAGGGTASVTDQGLALARENKLGAAQLLAQAARDLSLPNRDQLDFAVRNLSQQQPSWQIWGGTEPRLDPLFQSAVGVTNSASLPFADFAIRLANREKALQLLQSSQLPVVQELLRTRALTNTVIFSPSRSASGQAYDAAIVITGLLAHQGYLSAGLNNSLGTLATAANRGADLRPLEQALLDFLSLGQRLNWGQLTAFVGGIDDPQTLRSLANFVRKSDSQLPVLFSAVALSDQPASVAHYLTTFSQTGTNDLRASLCFGAGGVRELLHRNQPLHTPRFRQHLASLPPFNAFFRVAADYAWRQPALALAGKWLLYLAGGFLLALALHFAQPAVAPLEQPLQVRGFHLVRELLFGLGFLVVMLLLSEPFLAQDSQQSEPPAFGVRLSAVGDAIRAGTAAPAKNTPIMNNLSLLILALFFVIQGLLYTASLVKLAEIRRQRVPARVKLMLLKNEEHLFDAGLYLGVCCTVVSLILVSFNIIHASRMTGFASTSFGILFVLIFKIAHLRPAARRLLLEAESAAPQSPAAPDDDAQSFVSPS